MSGMFLWLIVWRWLNKRGQGTAPRALALLAVAAGVFTALFEAFWEWIYQDFEFGWVLGQNFDLTFGISAAWYNLGVGLLIALGAFLRHAPPPLTAQSKAG